MREKIFSSKGWTLIEMLIVVGIIGIILGIAAFNHQFIIQRGYIAEAKGSLRALQAATENYYIHNDNSFPGSLNDLTSAVPNIIGSSIPDDPFNPGLDFGYNVSGNGYYYAIFSVGTEGSGSASISDDGVISESGSTCIYVSNISEDVEP